MIKKTFCFSLIFLVCSITAADKVYLKNGDSLTGKIKTMTDNKLVLKSEMAGEIQIPFENIRTFGTSEAVKLQLQDGSVINVKTESSEPNTVSIKEGQTLEKQSLAFSELKSINPPPEKKPRWAGDFSAGYSSTHGNTQTQNISASFNMKKRTENDRTTFTGDYARSEQTDDDTGEDETTENWWRLKGKYDYFFSKKFYTYLDTRYETDEIAELDSRYIVGSGFGKQWIESEEMNFSTEGGLAYVKENFETEGDNSNCTVQMGYNFDKKINDKLKIINDLTYYPSWEDVSDYILTTTGEIRYKLNDRLFTNFRAIFDYDSTPAEGAGNTDTKYLLGVGGTF